MSYVILDLEWNGSYSKAQKRYVNEIIEFGAVKLDDSFKIIDRFSLLVAPLIGKKLCSKVKALTKLTNEELMTSGVTFLKAVSRFSKFTGDSVLLTWGTSDIHALVENYSYYTHKTKIPFLKRYCDLQEYCEKSLGLESTASQLGLGACAEQLGIMFSEGDQHRALADAELSFNCLECFIDRFPLEPYIVNADCNEFYDRMLFKTYYITDLNSPHIDKAQLEFCCEECGVSATRLTKWRPHNRALMADFECPDCGVRFSGRVSFKKKYDCVDVKRKIIYPKPEEAEQQENNEEQTLKSS